MLTHTRLAAGLEPLSVPGATRTVSPIPPRGNRVPRWPRPSAAIKQTKNARESNQSPGKSKSCGTRQSFIRNYVVPSSMEIVAFFEPQKLGRISPGRIGFLATPTGLWLSLLFVKKLLRFNLTTNFAVGIARSSSTFAVQRRPRTRLPVMPGES